MTVMQEIKERFDAEGIEIPFPHVSLYAGAATGPFPVSFTAEDGTESRHYGTEPDEGGAP